MVIAQWWKKLGGSKESQLPFSGEALLEALPYVVVDTELTSLDSSSNRVLSIGALRMEGGKLRVGEQFYRVIDPGVPVPAEVVVVHGLRPADVLAGETPEIAVPEFLAFAEGAVLVGHFVSIDLAALKKEAAPASRLLDQPAIDTAKVQRWIDAQRSRYREDRGHVFERLDLASLAQRYGLEHQHAHHALYDAYLAAQLWQRQMHELKLMKVTSFNALLRIARAPA